MAVRRFACVISPIYMFSSYIWQMSVCVRQNIIAIVTAPFFVCVVVVIATVGKRRANK